MALQVVQDLAPGLAPTTHAFEPGLRQVEHADTRHSGAFQSAVETAVVAGDDRAVEVVATDARGLQPAVLAHLLGLSLACAAKAPAARIRVAQVPRLTGRCVKCTVCNEAGLGLGLALKRGRGRDPGRVARTTQED